MRELIGALERLGIRYFVGGSIASSARGVFRATADVDLVVAAGDGAGLARLGAELGPGWYVDEHALEAAFGQRRSFNLIHMPSASKFDLFAAWGAFEDSEMERATETDLCALGLEIRCPVASAEDILLAKLAWFRAGAEVSERQWTDITQLLAANPAMDCEYLNRWAAHLGVADLLAKARDLVSGGGPVPRM